NVVKSSSNIIERAITELMEFISSHQSLPLELIHIYYSMRVTVVLLLHDCKYGNWNDSSSGVNIFRRSQVACISVEALAFGTPVWSAQQPLFLSLKLSNVCLSLHPLDILDLY
ncbi:hypothetical protein Tco_0068851, partial [Tanacetum coccineum]